MAYSGQAGRRWRWRRELTGEKIYEASNTEPATGGQPPLRPRVGPGSLGWWRHCSAVPQFGVRLMHIRLIHLVVPLVLPCLVMAQDRDYSTSSISGSSLRTCFDPHLRMVDSRLTLGADGSFDAQAFEAAGFVGGIEMGQMGQPKGEAEGTWRLSSGQVVLSKSSSSGPLRGRFDRFNIVRHMNVAGLLPVDSDETPRAKERQQQWEAPYEFRRLLLPKSREKGLLTPSLEAEAIARWKAFVPAAKSQDPMQIKDFINTIVEFDGVRGGDRSTQELTFTVSTDTFHVACVVENILDSTRLIQYWPCGMNGGTVAGRIMSYNIAKKQVYVRPIFAAMKWAR